MDIKKFERDFLHANAKTAITVMNATGWNAGIVNPAGMNVDSVFLYVFDQQTSWTWACSVPRHDFLDFIEKAQGLSQEERDEFPLLCSEVIAQALESFPQKNKISPATSNRPASGLIVDDDIENSIAFALSAYVGITKSYAMTENATKANHFVVIRYGASDMVRPFVSKGPAKHLISVDEISSAIEYVISLDFKNHPEWISGKSSDKIGRRP